MTRLRFLPALAVGALALTVSGCAGGNAADLLFGGYGGFCWLLHAIAVVWAFFQLANSHADTGSKLLWGALIFFFPLGGLLLWYFFGPKA